MGNYSSPNKGLTLFIFLGLNVIHPYNSNIGLSLFLKANFYQLNFSEACCFALARQGLAYDGKAKSKIS
jgi:hypothetical protein